MLASRVKDNLLLAAPSTTLEYSVQSHKTSLISGMPLRANKKEFPSTSNFSVLEGINDLKLLRVVKNS